MFQAISIETEAQEYREQHPFLLSEFATGLSEEEQRRSAAEKRLRELKTGSSLRDLEVLRDQRTRVFCCWGFVSFQTFQ